MLQPKDLSLAKTCNCINEDNSLT